MFAPLVFEIGEHVFELGKHVFPPRVSAAISLLLMRAKAGLLDLEMGAGRGGSQREGDHTVEAVGRVLVREIPG